jgi:tetratricopeptide (TPR) repeat protein
MERRGLMTMKVSRNLMTSVLLGLLAAGCGLSTDVARVKGYDALRGGRADEARRYFEKCVQQDATDWKSHYYLGRIALDFGGDPYYARRHLEIAETIRKSLPDSQLAPRPGAPQTAVPFPTRHQIADALAESMLRQNLRARLNNYVRQQATDFGEAEDYMRVGRYLHALGDHDSAAIAYVQATMIADPTDARPHLELAAFYDAVGDRPAALIELRKAYFIDPAIKGLADNIRRHGMVPGPTIAIAPERDKPVIVRRGVEDRTEPVYPKPEGTAQP